jgi:quercetin dioxygenase-like cupin family protein
MSNFIIISDTVDVDKMLQQVKDNPDDWNAIKDYPNIGGKTNPYGFMPLVMAVVQNREDSPKNSELQKNTPLHSKYTEIHKFLRSYGIEQTSRAAFFRLYSGDSVGEHVDDGSYYATRDRYHICLQGEYLYSVGGETKQIKPGMFFWFDNKKSHWAFSNGKEDRITFVFDLPHSKNNPQHLISSR